MAKILGLDLGTNSIGWAVVDDKKGEETQLLDKGVLIFTEGVRKEKGQEKSKAAERTSFRSSRRLNFRRKIRKYQTLLVLSKYKMCPLTIGEVKEWRKSNFKKYPIKPDFLNWLKTDEDLNINPYYFRDRASREKISSYDLGRALYHIAQRRGFLSNRLDQSDDNLIKSKKDEIQELVNNGSLNKIELINKIETLFESYEFKDKNKKDCANATEVKLWSIRKYIINVVENKIKGKDYSKIEDVKNEIDRYINKPENLGAVQGNISDLNKAIKDTKCKTLGQYFWKIYQDDRNDTKNKIRSNYTSREEHYLDEFEIICKTQHLDSIDDSKKDANERYKGIVKELYKAIFYQRPLKSQKGLVGKCSLEPNRTRCSTSRPEFEEFRMYSFINSIKIKTGDDGKFRFLSKEERKKITSCFYRKSKPTFAFEDIKKILGTDYLYNYKDKATVSGCPTIANLSNVFGNDWKNVIFENYTDKNIINRKTKAIIKSKTKNEVIADVWHVLSTYTSDEKLKDFALHKLMVNEIKANKFAKIHLKKDYASLSLYVINKILPYLKKGSLYSHAVFMANMEKIVKPEKWESETDRKFIEKGVEKIIDNHQEENKVVFVINSLLTNCYDRDNNFNYSKEAEKGFQDDLEKSLKKEFGIKNWESIDNKEEVLNKAFEKFILYLKDRKRIKIKRIDEKIIDFLKGENENGEIFCEDESLLKKLYHPSDIEKFKWVTIKDKNNNQYKGLGSPEVGSIKNPMAMKALHQLKKLINTLILEGQIDENTKINLELSRQLNDANRRKAIEKWQNDRKELYQVYADKIKELYPKENKGKTIENLTDTDIEKFAYVLEQRKDGKIVSKEDVMKYTLWEEQNHICLYTGKTISLSSFLGANPTYDIEHTLPRSRSWDNSQMNKTLCENIFNRDTKGNNTPFELQMADEILPRIQHWNKKYEDLNDEIEKLKRQSRSATEKEQKDRLIQRRHYLKMEHDYWKGKYSRFIMPEIKEGFKNSQAVDIGIISKYARAYLKSVFDKVYSVKGEMVAEYRKAWGLHDTFKDKLGRTQYKPKDRSNHIHHCIDAVTIASMNKNKYDKLAHAWGLEDKGEYNEAKKELENEKPWKTFTEDVRNLENEVFIVHHNKDVLPIQTKKKFRKRGKVQKDKNGNTIYQKGDTVRGSLHLDTYYGAIAKGKSGIIKKDNSDNVIPNYVVRKELTKLKKSDVVNIVDKNIREIVERAAQNKLIIFSTNGAKINEPIWQNKEKQIPLKKVRVYTPSVKSPLKDFKKHATPFLSKKKYKQQFNVVNEENYCMAIYEGKNEKGKVKRDFELVNNIEAGEYYRLSNNNHRVEYPIVPNPHSKSNLPLKYILKKGMMVLMYDSKPDEIWNLSQTQLLGRLFEITQLDVEKYAEIKLLHHQEAREKKEITKYMGLKTGMKGGKNIDNYKQYPWIKIGYTTFDCLVKGYDFKITPTGKIEKI